MTKPNLEIGKKYIVEDYPNEEIFESEYLGVSTLEKRHVFKTQIDGSNAYLILEDHWIVEIEETVTYSPRSSSGIEVITEKAIESNTKTQNRIEAILVGLK